MKKIEDITLGDIIERYRAEAEIKKLAKNTIKTQMSAFNIYMALFNANENDCANQFKGFINFEETVKKIGKTRWNASTISGKISAINQFYKTYIKLLQENDIAQIGNNFGDRLRYFRQLKCLRAKDLADLAGITDELHHNTIYAWETNNNLPNIKNFEFIKKFEEILDCNGLLTCCVEPQLLLGRKKQLKELEDDSYYSQRSRFSALHPYGLKFDKFPKKLAEEWLDLVAYKTSNKAPFKLKRNSKWQSAFDNQQKIECFFGFLLLDQNAENEWMRGLGLQIKELRLSMLVNPEYLYKYTLFLHNRTKYVCDKDNQVVLYRDEGLNTTTQQSILILAKSLVSEKGYFTQRSQLKRKFDIIDEDVISDITGKSISWKKYCKQSFDNITELLNEEFQEAHDTKSIVNHLLNNRNRHEVITIHIPELIKKIKGFLPPKNKLDNLTCTHLKWARRLLLLCFVYVNPLRTAQMADLTFSKDGNDADIILINGTWTWNIKKKRFKNCKHLKHDYIAPFPPWLNTIFEDYISIYRPLMFGGGVLKNGQLECPYVFRQNRTYKEIKPVHSSLIANDSKAITKMLPGCKSGFRLHLFRYLLSSAASSFGGKKMAASIINDSELITDEVYIADESHDNICEYLEITEAIISGEKIKTPEKNHNLYSTEDKLRKEIEALKKKNEELTNTNNKLVKKLLVLMK